MIVYGWGMIWDAMAQNGPQCSSQSGDSVSMIVCKAQTRWN
jgi:hypothetical protein